MRLARSSFHACESAREQLSRQLDHELSELDHARLDAHLEQCAACRAFAAEIGAVTQEAYARLAAARRLVDAGRRAEADMQLGRALAFYRSVSARRYILEGEGLLAASA